MKVNVKVIETLSREISVDADSIDEGLNIVQDMYSKEEIVLDYSDFNNVCMEEKIDDFGSKKDYLVYQLIRYLSDDEYKHYEESERPDNHIYLTILELEKMIARN